MRLKITLVSVLLPAALALALASPPALASAASTPHTGSSAVTARTNNVSVPISITPGTHTVSETIPISPPSAGVGSFHLPSRSDRSSSGAISLASSPEIQVRVGSENCAGFNGQESIYISGYDTDPAGDEFPLWALQVWGIEWDNCGVYTVEYTYVKFSAGGVGFNQYIVPTVSGDGSTGVNQVWPTALAAPSNVYVTACLSVLPGNGWECGKGAGPFNH
jgi:ABC-type transport system substrate-binding protein